jgi:hypothetical protein
MVNKTARGKRHGGRGVNFQPENASKMVKKVDFLRIDDSI